MREEYSAPDTDSPERPSAWQLRFGKGSTSRSKQSKQESVIHPHSSAARSPSIADQLLRALDAKSLKQEESSRECVDQLIGRRNAFATEPELRLRNMTRRSENDNTPENGLYDCEDMEAEAKEIIRVRFQIENQADTLRQASVPQKHQKRRPEATSRRISSVVTPQTHPRVSRMPAREKKPSARITQPGGDNQKAAIEPTMRRQPQQQSRNRNAFSTGISNERPPLSQPPHQQLPMERRQQLLQQARDGRKLKTAEDKALLQLRQRVSVDNNKEDIEEQRRIEDRIERLTVENQQAVTLEERFQRRKERFETLGRVFGYWQKYVENRREQEARVVAELRWRTLKSVVTNWKRYTHRQRQIRAVERAREKLVREQLLNKQAQEFHRLKCLPKWFYQWASLVAQLKEQRAADGAAERRKAQSERLIERLLRQKSCTDKGQEGLGEQQQSDVLEHTEEQLPQTAIHDYAPRVRGRTRSSNALAKLRQNRRDEHAWSGGEEQEVPPPGSSGNVPVNALTGLPPPTQLSGVALTRTTKRVDKVYRAMEQRAIERKQRREELKRRYGEIEQLKRQEQEEQRAAREAILLQQRIEEKARIRERRLAEARAQQEKQDRRDQMLAQWHKANKHNRRRLLFFYALLPWRKHHAINQRVARNASRWYELRTVYSHWSQWQEFVLVCRKRHQRRERAQMGKAAKHHARSLQRRALWGLLRYHQAIEACAVSVFRQHRWNSLQHAWSHWYKRLANERAYRRKVAVAAAAKLQDAKLHRIFSQWREATSESKLQRELEHEKQQLWRKVRGWLDEV